MSLNKLQTFIKQNDLQHEDLSREEIQELYDLIQEIGKERFVLSSELSRHIVRHKLGFKYPNISGIVTMKNANSQWNFKGGFPPKIYRIVCEILGLRSKGTLSRVVKFESYASMR